MMAGLAVMWLLGIPGAWLIVREQTKPLRALITLTWLPAIVLATFFACLAECWTALADSLDSREHRTPE